MGRTIYSATQTWVEEEKALMRFVRALRKNDQVLVQELLALSRKHIAEASYASNLYPMDIYLVAMLLELFKKVKHLETRLEKLGISPVSTDSLNLPGFPTLVDMLCSSPEVEIADENSAAAGVLYEDVVDGE